MTLAGRMLQTSLTHFWLKICLSQPHKMLQAKKTFEACEVKKKLSVTKRYQSDESLEERLWSA